VISRRLFIGTLAGGLLSAPFNGEAQRPATPRVPLSLTRGQWTRYGNGTFAQSVWVGDGISPNDTVPIGTSLGRYLGGSTEYEAAFNDWCGGDYDTDRDELPILLPGGHSSWSTNEVNFWSLASGTWNPGGRYMNPTVRLFSKIFEAGKPRSPGFLFDDGQFNGLPNIYPNHAELDSRGNRAYPNARHSYGGIVYMPAPYRKFFMAGGYPWWEASANGPPYLWGSGYAEPAEWDPATKKYRRLDLDQLGALDRYSGTPYGCWDPIQGRVLMHFASKLFAYYPGKAYGSRIVQVNPSNEPFVDTSYVTMMFDAKRNRAVVFGGAAAADGQSAGSSYYDFSKNSMLASRVNARVTGDLPGGAGPGARYDPLGDRYVIWNGGKTLVFINPDTWMGTSFTPAGGDTPTIPTLAGKPGGGTWNRFFYSPTHDVFGVISHAHDQGAFIFAPART